MSEARARLKRVQELNEAVHRAEVVRHETLQKLLPAGTRIRFKKGRGFVEGEVVGTYYDIVRVRHDNGKVTRNYAFWIAKGFIWDETLGEYVSASGPLYGGLV